MKLLSPVFAALLFAACSSGSTTRAPQESSSSTIPITSQSPEAIARFQKGVDLLDNLRTAEAENEFSAAIGARRRVRSGACVSRPGTSRPRRIGGDSKRCGGVRWSAGGGACVDRRDPGEPRRRSREDPRSRHAPDATCAGRSERPLPAWGPAAQRPEVCGVCRVAAARHRAQSEGRRCPEHARVCRSAAGRHRRRRCRLYRVRPRAAG